MRKALLHLSLAVLIAGLLCLKGFAQEETDNSPAPDSKYFEQEEAPKASNRGGFFDFLPFVGKRKDVERENLKPSPRPKKSERIFSQKHLEELQRVAAQWLLVSEFTEPTLRRDEQGRYYRDYIVFAGDYEIQVLRGDSEDKPFVGHVYVKGDYFTTQLHDDPDEARADFNFHYESRDFRLIFERAEKWEFSDDTGAEPFAFTEEWEFSKIQSRPTIKVSGDAPPEKPSAGIDDTDGERESERD